MQPPLLKPLSVAILGMLTWQAQAAAPANAFTGLGFLGTGNYSDTSAISADGSVVVGVSSVVVSSNGSTDEAFRWAGGVMTGLGVLGTGYNSSAWAVSADGSVVLL